MTRKKLETGSGLLRKPNEVHQMLEEIPERRYIGGTMTEGNRSAMEG